MTGVLSDPIIELYSGSTLTLSNDDWKATQQAAIQSTGLAPLNDLEAALLVTLPPRAYTMIVRGKNGATGVGIVETFLVD